MLYGYHDHTSPLELETSKRQNEQQSPAVTFHCDAVHVTRASHPSGHIQISADQISTKYLGVATTNRLSVSHIFVAEWMKENADIKTKIRQGE